jgi:hypothetical protein
MREFNIAAMLIKKFSSYIENMDEVVSNLEPAAQYEDQKLFLHVFSSEGKDSNPLRKISFMTLEEGEIKNKDDNSRLDVGEFTVATFIPSDLYPLPLFNMECSIHFNKYIQCRAEIPPMSKDERYTEIFCKPVRELRQSLESLPGLYPHVSLPGLEAFSSGGLLTAHIDTQNKDIGLKWFLDYADLYLSFVNNLEKYAILKDPAIIEEGKQQKNTFCQMFKKMSPRILSDLPGLSSEELGMKLGDLLF